MRSLVFVLLVGCTTYVPAPVSPTPPVVKAEPVNEALAFAADFLAHTPLAGTKCTPWTGHGATTPGIDSVRCAAATVIIWCGVPHDAKPKCELAADWTPQPSPDKGEVVPPGSTGKLTENPSKKKP